MNHEIIKELVHSLAKCVHKCNACLNACLEEEDVAMMKECIRLDRECAVICAAALQLVNKHARFKREILMVCKNACTACAQECRMHNYEHCHRCAEACEKCAQACAAFLEAHAGHGENGQCEK